MKTELGRLTMGSLAVVLLGWLAWLASNQFKEDSTAAQISIWTMILLCFAVLAGTVMQTPKG